MASRKLLVTLLLSALSVLGVVLMRRRSARRRERVDVYFEDGSMVSLEDDSPEAGRLLPLAHDLLRTARTTT